MQTIQVVLDARLLKATDLAARRNRVNRSALIRQPLERYLEYLHEPELEERERRGYNAKPQQEDEFRVWEEAASWPRPWREASSPLPIPSSGQAEAGSHPDSRQLH